MTSYGEQFAGVYSREWTRFADNLAPVLRELYEAQPINEGHRSLLDVACGTGHLMKHFLAHGYTALGIDLSPAMLAEARRTVADYAENVTFLQADASNFAVKGRFGLAVSTFDALNHLPDSDALAGCIRSVRRALVDGGLFVFDLNTRRGLMDRWRGMTVSDTDELFLLQYGIYDGGERAVTQLTGFIQGDDGRYDRFTETVHNTVFRMDAVREMLAAAGFPRVTVASLPDLTRPVEDAESLNRAFFIAHAG